MPNFKPADHSPVPKHNEIPPPLVTVHTAPLGALNISRGFTY